MIYEIQKAREIYKSQSDNFLLTIAQENFKSLRAEIIPVIIDELRRRNIGEEIIDHYEQNHEILDEKNISKWISKIRDSNCPKCNKKVHELVCFTGRNTVSFITRSVYLKRIFITCKYCRTELLRRLNFETFVLGWWSVSGFFRTPYSILQNLINNNLPKKTESENLFRYVIQHHDQLKQYENKITEYIEKENKA